MQNEKTPKNKPIITRFPPSPTGFLHIGRVRTALFNFLFTQKNKGKMVFRIEDTDRERSKKEYEEDIIESLKWLGISYDEGPLRQSERTDLYKKYLKKMVESGAAYVSKEIPKEEGDREEVIRFKNPNKKITFTDFIRGEITFDTTDLGDFIIARSMDEPLYHLAVVVDDFEMGITHILRGDDGISNTPRQILIQEAIGAPLPIYAHIPLILAPDKSKLSGRHGAISVSEYRKNGYVPQALINYMALLGWNPGTPQEIFSMDELIKEFDISKIQKSGAIFNIEKLNWFNKKYIDTMSLDEFKTHAEKFLPSDFPKEFKEKIIPLLKEKIQFFGEIPKFIEGELSFISNVISYPKESLTWKGDTLENAKKHINFVMQTLQAITDSQFNKEKVKEIIWPYAEREGKGNVLWPMRYALSGKEKSPDPFVISEILGKEKTLERLKKAYEII